MKLSQLSARLSSAAALLASALCPVWMPEAIGQECACQTQVSPSSVTAFVPRVPFGPFVPGMTQGQAPFTGFAGQFPAGQKNVAQGSRLPAGWPAQWGDPIVTVPGKANGQNQNLATRANVNEGLVRDPFTGQMVPTSLQARWDKVTTTRNTTTDPATEVKTKEEAKSVMVAEKSTDKSETPDKADKSASGSSSKKPKSSGGGGGAPGGAFGAGSGMGGGGNGGGMGGGMAGGGNGGGGGGNGTNGINWNPQTGGAGNAGGGGGNNNERTANAVLNEKVDTGTTTGGGTTGGGGSNGGGCLIDVNPPTPSVPPCDHGGHGGNGSSHGNGPGNGGNGNVPPGTGGTDPGSPVVPEPGTALLLGIGGAIAGVRYLRRRNAAEPAAV